MATTQYQVTGDTTRTLTSTTRSIGPGRLTGITTQVLATGTNPAQTFVRVLLSGQNVGASSYRHLILQTYIGFESGDSWTGDFLLDDDTQITTDVLSSTTAIVITSVTTEPI